MKTTPSKLRCTLCVGALSVGALGSCSVEDAVLGHVRGAPGGNPGSETGIDGGGVGNAGHAGTAGSGATLPSACPSTSPSVTMPGITGYSTCTARIAAATFNNALCTCNGVQLRQGLTTVGFDSIHGAYVPGLDDSGAAVGINGTYQTVAGSTDIGGSLSIAGTEDVHFVGYLATLGDLRVAGNVEVAGYASVARNAWLGGSFTGLGPLTVIGELHHAQGVSALPLMTGPEVLEAVTISKPCPCEAAELVPIEQLVNAAKQRNDNQQYQIDENALGAINGDVQLLLPCGKFYLSQITGTGNVVIRVDGLVALFIDGSINLNGNLQVELASGAELDLFFGGNVAVTGAMNLGDQARPAASRIFIAGTEDIALTSPLTGNLYAPHARVFSLSRIDVYGSIFARDFAGDNVAKIVFDRAVYEADAHCAEGRPPPGTCTLCGVCTGGTACVDGSCTYCRDDYDCCSQTVCDSGRCSPLLELR